MQKVDLGIALCHFALAAKENAINICFDMNDPGIETEADMEYIASYLAVCSYPFHRYQGPAHQFVYAAFKKISQYPQHLGEDAVLAFHIYRTEHIDFKVEKGYSINIDSSIFRRVWRKEMIITMTLSRRCCRAM